MTNDNAVLLVYWLVRFSIIFFHMFFIFSYFHCCCHGRTPSMHSETSQFFFIHIPFTRLSRVYSSKVFIHNVFVSSHSSCHRCIVSFHNQSIMVLLNEIPSKQKLCYSNTQNKRVHMMVYGRYIYMIFEWTTGHRRLTISIECVSCGKQSRKIN